MSDVLLLHTPEKLFMFVLHSVSYPFHVYLNRVLLEMLSN